MIEYGITTSKAHVWVHVCPLDAAIYWYQRKQILPLLERAPEREIASAKGRLVRLFGNRDCDGGPIKTIDLGSEWFSAWPWKECETDRQAGEIAEAAFARLVSEHKFPFPLIATRYEHKAEQFQGKDYRLTPKLEGFDVEVKADFAGGEWGTGNLFVQTHEGGHRHGKRHAHRAA